MCKYLLSLLVLFLLAQNGNAQEYILPAKESSILLLREINENQRIAPLADTLKLPSIDSLAVKFELDSLRKPAGQDKSLQAKDDLKDVLSHPLTEVNQRGDKLRHRVDSLQNKTIQPVEKLNKEVVSVENQAAQKLNHVNDNIDQRSRQLQQKAQQEVTRATDGEVSLPGKDLKTGETGIALPPKGVANVDLSEQKLPGIDNVSQPGLPPGDIPLLQLPDEDLGLDQLKSKSIPGTDKIKGVTGDIKGIDSKLGEVKKYEMELQEIRNKELPATDEVAKQAEEKVASLDQLKAVNGETEKLAKLRAEQEALLQRYRDKKLLQQEIQRKAKGVVNDKLNQFSPVFKETQEMVAKAKKANPTVQSLKDIRKKRPNPVADIPLRERLVPGITLQVHTNDVFTIDWGTQLGYKLTGRLTLGAGGVYRAAVSEDYSTLVKGAGVWGTRGYAHFGLFKSFYFHGEFESLHVRAAAFAVKRSEERRHHVNSGYLGIGKRYDLSRKIRGSVVVLYRAEFHGTHPSMNKINLRLGFDYNLKKGMKIK